MTPDSLPEPYRERRGHDFYPPADLAAGIPPLYATEGQPLKERVVYLHYFVGACDWWLVEYDPAERLAFGFVCLGDVQMAEWGLVPLDELVAVYPHPLYIVERDLYWTPGAAGEVIPYLR